MATSLAVSDKQITNSPESLASFVGARQSPGKPIETRNGLYMVELFSFTFAPVYQLLQSIRLYFVTSLYFVVLCASQIPAFDLSETVRAARAGTTSDLI